MKKVGDGVAVVIMCAEEKSRDYAAKSLIYHSNRKFDGHSIAELPKTL